MNDNVRGRAGASEVLASAGEVFDIARELADAAQMPGQPASKADPADVCDLVLEEFQRDGLPQLRYWGGSWWWWANGKYVELNDDKPVRACILRRFTREYANVKRCH